MQWKFNRLQCKISNKLFCISQKVFIAFSILKIVFRNTRNYFIFVDEIYRQSSTKNIITYSSTPKYIRKLTSLNRNVYI